MVETKRQTDEHAAKEKQERRRTRK